MTDSQARLTVAVVVLVTALIRFLPFVVWNGNRKTPRIIENLGRVLPCAVMGMLVVYCLKHVNFSSPAGFVPEIVAGLCVGITYVWKRNTLISIVCGTLCYMVLVQMA